MRKDADALKSSGGTGVESGTFNPMDLAGDSEFAPQVDAVSKSPAPQTKALIISVSAVVVLALAAAAVYFFVLPLFSGDEPEVTVEETETVEEETPEPTAPEFVHESFFATAPDSLIASDLEEMTVSAINSAVSAGDGAAGTIDEITFNIGGAAIKTEDIMGVLLPGLDPSSFDEDFTTFVYRTAGGDWPGYVFMLGAEQSLQSVVENVMEGIEEQTNLKAFYVEDPGTADAGGFKNGSASGVSTRYIPFSKEDASFNYGWSGNYLVISTSFSGIQEAFGLLGS